ALGGPVVERVVSDGDRARAAVGSRGRVSVGERGGRGGDLAGGLWAVLALGGPVEYRLAVRGAEQVLELPVGDAAVPNARVVGRVAGHGEDPAGGGHHHGRAAGGAGVAVALRAPDGLGQRAVGVRLEPGVEAGDQGVAGLGAGLVADAGDRACRVDGQRLLARGTAGLLVVVPLQARLADQVHAGEAGHRKVALRQLLRRDRLQVAQDLRGVGGERLDVVGDRLGLRGHPGEVALVLHDLQRDRRGYLL